MIGIVALSGNGLLSVPGQLIPIAIFNLNTEVWL